MHDAMQWRDADGVVTPLDGSVGISVLEGVEGRWMPPVEFEDESLIGRDGTQLRNMRFGRRDVVLPLAVHEDVCGGMAAEAMRQVVHRLNPRRGDGYLIDVEGGRRLRCRYLEGLEVIERRTLRHVPWVTVVVVLRAFDPMWEAAQPTIRRITIEGEPFLSVGDEAWFPWSLSTVAAAGSFGVMNEGDEATWPVWTILGPASRVRLTNETYGRVLELDTTIGAGVTVTVDTRPGAKTITDGAGTNLYPDLTDESVLWPLERGGQTVRVGADDATEDTRVSVEWRTRHLTP